MSARKKAKARSSKAVRDFAIGYGLALADVLRNDVDCGCKDAVRSSANDAGIYLRDLHAAGMDDADIETLRDAGIPWVAGGGS